MKTKIRLLVAALALTGWLAGCQPAPRQQVTRANEAYERGEYDAALDGYQSALAERPDTGELLYNAGNVRYRQGQLQEAQRLLQAAIDDGDPAVVAAAYFNLGNVRATMGNWPAAVEAYKETLRRRPQDTAAKYNLELALAQIVEPPPEEDESEEEEDDSEEAAGEDAQTDQPDSGRPQPQPDDDGGANDGRSPDDTAEQTMPDPQGLPTDVDEPPTNSTVPQGALSPQQAEQLLDAVGGQAQTLQQQQQPAPGTVPNEPQKDW